MKVRTGGWLAIGVALAGLACGSDPDARIQEIRTRHQAGEFAQTIDPLRELLDATPDDPELNHLYGVALLGNGQPELAIWPLRKAAQDPDRAVDDGHLLSLALLRGGSAADAVEQALRVQELAPDRVDVLRLLLQARMEAKQHEEALEDAARLLELEPNDPDALLARVLALLSLDRPDEARPALADLRKAAEDRASGSPWPPRVCAATATFTKENGEPDAAEALWNSCLEEFPDEEVLVFGAIEFFDERPGPPRAIELLRRALETKPTHLPFIEALANQLGASGKSAEAEALLLAATRDGVNDVQAWFSLTRYYEQREETAKARDAMAQGLRMMGDAPATLVAAYVDLLIRAGDLDQAEELIPRFERSPVMVNMLRGRLLLARGQPAQALAALDEGLRLWPDHSVARWLAGVASEQLGDYDRALREYGEAVRNDRGNRDAVRSLLRLIEAQGLDREAMPVLARYLGENPKDPEMLVQALRFADRVGDRAAKRHAIRTLGTIRGQLGVLTAELAAIRSARSGPAAGVEELRKAALDLTLPMNGPALHLLVELLIADGRPAEAVDAVEAALLTHPDEAVLHELRGRALRASKDPGGAREALQRALELEPERASALAELAALTAEQGDRAAAIALYDQAARADPESAAYPWAAIQLVALHEDAAELDRRLEELLARHGTHAAAANLLAQRLLARDPARALALAQRAVRFGGGPDAVETLGRIERERGDAARQGAG